MPSFVVGLLAYLATFHAPDLSGLHDQLYVVREGMPAENVAAYEKLSQQMDRVIASTAGMAAFAGVMLGISSSRHKDMWTPKHLKLALLFTIFFALSPVILFAAASTPLAVRLWGLAFLSVSVAVLIALASTKNATKEAVEKTSATS